MGSKCSVASQVGSSQDKGGFLCFGHPLLDMMVPVDEALLKEYGVVAGSVNLAQPAQLPLFDHIAEKLADVVEYIPGGAAMNTARTLAWIRPDVPVSYVGALGTDKFADILKSSLSTGGVQPHFEEHSSKPTGTCACLLLDKERALLANLGAAVELSKGFIGSNAVRQCVQDADVYYAEGFFLNTASSPDGLLSVAKHSHEAGKTFCFNLNAPYISLVFQDRVNLLMPYIDILFGSSEDIMGYASVRWPTEFSNPTTSPNSPPHDSIGSNNNNNSCGDKDAEQGEFDLNPDDAAATEAQPLSSSALETAMLHSAVRKTADLPSHRGHRMVVITCGSGSTVIGCTGQDVRLFAVTPMASRDIVDFNGAGDAFVGGFLAQYTLFRDEKASAHVAHETAQNCIRHSGAVVSGPVPTLIQNSTGKHRSRSSLYS